MEKIKEIISKFLTKEVVLYIVFGILTTIVNLGSFYILANILHADENLANFIAILLAVLFAYFTNRKLVFNSTAIGFLKNFKEFCKFILGRSITMIIEWIGGVVLFTTPLPNIVSKLIVSVVVVILNFIISKFFTFKKN